MLQYKIMTELVQRYHITGSTAGEIATGGPSDAGVVVVALGGAGFTIQTTAVTGIAEDARQTGADAAGDVIVGDGEGDDAADDGRQQ